MGSTSKWGSQWLKYLHSSRMFSGEQMSVIADAIAATPECDKAANALVNEDNATELTSLFQHVLGGIKVRKRERGDTDGYLALLSDSEQRVYMESQRFRAGMSLDDAETHKITPPDAGHYTLGNLRSHRVCWTQRNNIDMAMCGTWWNQHSNDIQARLEALNLKVVVVDEVSRTDARLAYDSVMKVLFSVLTEVFRSLAVDPVGAQEVTYEVTYEVDELASTGACRQFPDGTLKVNGLDVMSVQAKTAKGGKKKQEELMAEARGQIVKRANAVYEGTAATQLLEVEYHGFATTGVDIQTVALRHKLGRKPKGVASPLKRLLTLPEPPVSVTRSKKKQQIPPQFVVGQSYPVDVKSEAMDFVICHCFEVASKYIKMRAAAEAKTVQAWRDGQPVKLRLTSGFKVGKKVVSVAKAGVEEEVEVRVMSELKVSPGSMSLARCVEWNSEKWWLKLGPDRDERQVEMSCMDGSCSWEEWFQVERDAMCHSLVGELSALPVEVEGINRPAMLVEDAGVTLQDRLQAGGIIQPDEVLEMSKQLFQTLARAFNTHGLCHNDVAPRNICFKDGSYRLIDWGMAQGKLDVLLDAVEEAWPRALAGLTIPPLVNWLLAPDRALYHAPARNLVDCIEPLVYCCMLLLGGGEKLPWSCGCEAMLELRRQALQKTNQDSSRKFIDAPLLSAVLQAKGVLNSDRAEPPGKKMRLNEVMDRHRNGTCVGIMLEQ